jgi:hypothetical protein
VSGQLHAPAALPQRKSSQYPLQRRLGEPLSRSGRREEDKYLSNNSSLIFRLEISPPVLLTCAWGLGPESNVQPTLSSLNDQLKILDVSLVRCQGLHSKRLGITRDLSVSNLIAVIFLDQEHSTCHPVIYTRVQPNSIKRVNTASALVLRTMLHCADNAASFSFYNTDLTLYGLVVSICSTRFTTLKTLHSAHTVYLCVPYGSHNKQRLSPNSINRLGFVAVK